MRETSAQESSGDELKALWGSGIPLDSAWIEFAKFIDRFSYTALCTHPTNDPDIRSLTEPRYIELFTGSWLPKTWEARQLKLTSTTKNERIYLLGEIYTGTHWAIGFRTLPNGSDELVRVPRQHFFFDDAGEHQQRPDIHWAKGELTVGSTSYFDIRVVRCPVASQESVKPSDKQSATEVAPDSIAAVSPQPRTGPGRPSNAEVIQAAIEDYARTDPGLRKPRVKRYRAYRTYISGQGIDPDFGFSDKTFERYESEFRRNRK